MKVDWASVLDFYNIEYTDRGGKTTRNHVNCACPFCGDDPGHHLGLNCLSGVAYCWRNPKHRFNDPAYVLSKIAKVSIEEAKSRLGLSSHADTIEEIDEKFKRVFGSATSAAVWTAVEETAWPSSAYLPTHARGSRFLNYLKKRGFVRPESLFMRYNLRVAHSGRFRNRVLFPAYDVEGQQVGWTGRSVLSKATMRYLSHPDGRTLASSVFVRRDAFHSSGRVLVLCEGPFDALKLDAFAPATMRLTAVSLFSVSYRTAQFDVIERLASMHDRLWIVFDNGAAAAAEQVRSQLASLNAEIKTLPPYPGVSDPGDLSKRLVREMLRDMV